MLTLGLMMSVDSLHVQDLRLYLVLLVRSVEPRTISSWQCRISS